MHQQLKRRITVLKRTGVAEICVKGPEDAGVNGFLAAFASHYEQETILVRPESGLVDGRSQISQIADKIGIDIDNRMAADAGNPVLEASVKQALFTEILNAMQKKGVGILVAPDIDNADALFGDFRDFLTVSWKYARIMKPDALTGPVMVTTGHGDTDTTVFRLKSPTQTEIEKFLQPLVNTEVLNRAGTPDLTMINRLRLSMNNALWQTPDRMAGAQKLAALSNKIHFGSIFASGLLGVSIEETQRIIQIGIAAGLLSPVDTGWVSLKGNKADHKAIRILTDLILKTGSPAAWKALWEVSKGQALHLSNDFLRTALQNGYGAEAMDMLVQKGINPDEDLKKHVLIVLKETVSPESDPETAFEISMLRGDLKKAALIAKQSESPLMKARIQYENRDLTGCLTTLNGIKPMPEAQLLRANCLMRMGDFDAAEAAALDVHTDNRILMTRVETMLGIIALHTGLYTRAAGKFQKALMEVESMGLTFVSAVLRDNLAITYEYMGRYTAAMTQLNDAIIRYSRSGSDSGVASGLVFMADLYTFFGEPMAAIKALDMADEIITQKGLNREALHAQAKRGEAMAEAGRLQKGSELLLQAGWQFRKKGLRIEAGQAIARGILYRVMAGLEPDAWEPDKKDDPEAWAIHGLAMGIFYAKQGQYMYAETLLTQSMNTFLERKAEYFYAWALWETAGLIKKQDNETAHQYIDQAGYVIKQIAGQVPEGFSDAFLKRRLPKIISEYRTKKRTQPVRKDHRAITAFEGMVGTSEIFTRTINIAHRVAGTNLPVLITGESGTGKELMAKMVHRLSDRSDGPFITINAAAVPEGVLAGELFGYEKGAFTGADKRRIGKFEAASHGTLFLDEIGDISPNLQKHLLRALENGQVQRLGSNDYIPVDARIIFATNRDLNMLVKRGKFRLDLFHRIAGLTVDLPALRERSDDIPALIDFLCRELEPLVGKRIELTTKAVGLLKDYAFPGNIRELRNILQSAAINCDAEVINHKSLLRFHPKLKKISLINDKSEINDLVNSVLNGKKSLAEARRGFEYTLVSQAMEQTNGNISQAARLLKMKRPRLSQMVKSFGLKDDIKKDVML